MKRVSHTPKQRSKSTGHVRVIAGQWRGRKLPVGNVEGLRPTTDRNKETLFNWLMHDVRDARCLDVFAGSGGLGIEALSRYASHCTFIEKDSGAAKQLKQNLSTLGANGEVIQGDSLQVISQLKNPFNIVFIDPPFNANLVNPTLSQLIKNQLISSNTLIYIEQEAHGPAINLPSGYDVIKHKSSSQLSYCLVSCEGLQRQTDI